MAAGHCDPIHGPLGGPKMGRQEEPGRQGEGKQGRSHYDLVKGLIRTQKRAGIWKKAAGPIMILSYSLQFERERKPKF